MIAPQLIIFLVLSTRMLNSTDFNGQYQNITYSTSGYNYSTTETLENKDYFNTIEKVENSQTEILKCLHSLNAKIDASAEKTTTIENILTNTNPTSKNFYSTLWRVSSLIQMQNNQEIKSEDIHNIIVNEYSYLNNYLTKRRSWFSFSNPFLSSLLKVSMFGIIPSVISCIWTYNDHLITPSIIFNGGFFIYLWVKNHTSLAKKQKAFEEVVLPYMQKNAWENHSTGIAKNKKQLVSNVNMLYPHGLNEFSEGEN